MEQKKSGNTPAFSLNQKKDELPQKTAPEGNPQEPVEQEQKDQPVKK
ncbi:hypothetical protein [Castellaniella sp.]|nr:hypothetical protein [Castellaniella sp.]